MKPRGCQTYDYWHDLITDIRKPKSLLDFTNMILRRFRLALVKEVKSDGEIAKWRLRRWLDVLDEIHEQGRCSACNHKEENGKMAKPIEFTIEPIPESDEDKAFSEMLAFFRNLIIASMGIYYIPPHRKKPCQNPQPTN